MGSGHTKVAYMKGCTINEMYLGWEIAPFSLFYITQVVKKQRSTLSFFSTHCNFRCFYVVHIQFKSFVPVTCLICSILPRLVHRSSSCYYVSDWHCRCCSTHATSQVVISPKPSNSGAQTLLHERWRCSTFWGHRMVNWETPVAMRPSQPLGPPGSSP